MMHTCRNTFLRAMTPLLVMAAWCVAYANTPRWTAVSGIGTATYGDDDRISSLNGTVVFPVNRTEIPAGDAFVSELRQQVLPLILQQQLELYRIEVCGAASPEGGTANNERLAIGRTRVLVDTITSILPTAKGEIFSTTSITEDYEYLVQLMEQAGDRDAALVRQLYDKWHHRPADLKWTLFTYNKRQLWKRLLQEYFPQLRATRVILHFRLRPDAVPEPAPAPVPEPEPIPEPEPVPADEVQILPPDVPLPVADTIIVTDTIHRRPLLAVSTNLIYDLWYQPDFGFAPMWNGKVELYPRRGHFTYAIGFTNPYYHKWDEHKFFQIRNYEIEARWYRRYDRESGQRWGWYLGAAIESSRR